MNRKLRQDAELRANHNNNAQQQQHPHSFGTIIPQQYQQHQQSATMTTFMTPYSNVHNHNINNDHHLYSSYDTPRTQQHIQVSSPTIQSFSNHTDQSQSSLSTNEGKVNHRQQDEIDISSNTRKEWQQYGTIKTQVLEDIRYGRLHTTNSYNNNNNNRVWKIGKVIRAEQRTDITGATYTTYIIHIWDRSTTTPNTATSTTTAISSTSYNHLNHPVPMNNYNNNNKNLSSIHVLERRYSDFYKLYNSLCTSSTFNNRTTKQQNNFNESTHVSLLLSYSDWYNTIQNIFPNKHWAGRLGNWTPSLYIAPQQHHNMINERIYTLDAWFVYILYAYNIYHYPVVQQQQQISNNNNNNTTSFLSQQQYNIIHEFITNISPSPPYMNRSTITTTISPTINNNTNHTTTTTIQWNNPVTFTLSSAIRQATMTVQTMTKQVQQQQSQNQSINNNNTNNHSTTTIPIDLLHIATGIVFLTVAKIGMIVSGRVGTGVLIAKHPISSSSSTTTTPINPQQQTDTTNNPTAAASSNRWSAPVAVGTIGLGWGAVIGGDVTHYMIVLTTNDAVLDFGRNHTVHLGTELGISLGPMGVAASQQVQTTSKNYLQYHSAYAYAISSGLFFGVSLEGSMISIRNDVNAKFYGQPNISTMDLLQSPGVPAAESLYDALDIAIQQEVPEHAVFKLSRYIQPK